MTQEIPYTYGRASIAGAELIVGNVERDNPIQAKRKLILPLDKMRVGDALFFNKDEIPKWKIDVARETANRYNRLHDYPFGFVKTVLHFEIVRIK